MASSGNFCTLNPLTQPNAGTFSEGNLLFEHTASAWRSTLGTLGMTSGKWYWEAYQKEDVSGNGFPVGIYDADSGKFASNQAGDYLGQATSTYGNNYVAYTNSGSYSEKRNNGSNSNMTLSAGASGDVWQCALDIDNGKIWFGKNNTWDNSGNPATGSNASFTSVPTTTWMPVTCSYNTSNSEDYPQNYGQDSSFAGRITAGGNADENGFGDFKYAPPTGFLALCSGNLPVSDDIDPAGDDGANENSTKQFGVVLYTGNATNPHAISGLGFQPDMVWIHRRSGGSSFGNGIIDSSRGVSLGLFPPRTDADTSFTNDFSSFDSDGFTLKAGSSMNLNNSGSPFVAHCWRANGGTTSSNSEGDITSSVQANTAAGFSIVTYSGDLTSSGNRTVGHGLSKAPDFIIRKSRNTTERWAVSHVGCTSFNEMLELDTTAAEVDKSGNGSMSAPTTTVFSNNYTDGYAVNGTNYIAYCWHSVDGYSKFGKYEGNGNANGPFIYTGFRPRLFVQKRIDSTGSWRVWDASRHPYNPNDAILRWEDSAGEDTANGIVDFLSNGVKIRMTYAEMNASGGEFVYMCWGDVPFKYNNTF